MKKRESLIVLIFIIILILILKFTFASLFTTITQGDFDNGTYYQTFYNSSFIQLNISEGLLTGNYTSKIFNTTSNADWNNISWIEGIPYGEPLPDVQQVEIVLGAANMTRNILLMHLDETSGEINDSSGNSNNGTSIGTIYYGEIGKFGNAVRLDKSLGSSTIQIKNSSTTQFTDELSVEFWFKRENTGVFGTAGKYEFFVRKGTTSGLLYASSTWFVGGNANLNTIRFVVDTSSTGTVNTITQFTDTTWHYIVGTYNGTDIVLYVDGQLNNNATHPAVGNIEQTSYNISIGSNHPSHYSPDATIDEVAIYNRTLSAAEILEHYKRGSLNLNVTVRSCDDSSCNGDPWNDTFTSSPSTISINDSQFFQYKFDFSSDNESVTPEVYNLTLDYTQITFPNLTSKELTGRVTNTSATVNIINGHENISAYLEYGTTSASAGDYDSTTPTQENVANDTLIEFDISSLTPDTLYYYRLSAKRNNHSSYSHSDERTFRTRRDNAPFNFTIVSDIHTEESSPGFANSAADILNSMSDNDNSDFVFFLGDNIQVSDAGNGPIPNETHATTEYIEFRNVSGADYNSLPTYVLIGNWEAEGGWTGNTNLTLARNIRKKFIPNPNSTTYPEGGSDYEDYYAFTWGNALFVVLNIESYTLQNPHATGGSVDNWTLGTTQLNWFNDTLKNSAAPWKFVFIHHVAGGNWSGSANDELWSRYGRGGGRSAYIGEQATIHQIMRDNDVEIFFYGHDHVFTDIVVDQVHYVEVGRAGYTTGFTAGYPGYHINSLGRTKVEILSDEIMKIQYINTAESKVANITIDGMPPRIGITSPLNNAGDIDGNITFTFNVTDTSNIENCTLFFSNILNQTNTTIVKDLNTNFTINNLPEGNYTWFINCTDYNKTVDSAINYTYHPNTDYSPNMNSTGIKTLTVIINSEFTGNTTDFSNVNMSNISNLIIDKPSFGMINFTQNVNLKNGTHLNNNVNISYNRIFINSTAAPDLNKSAKLTLYNLNFTTPQILKDGSVCSDCTEESYNASGNGNLIFNVTSFSIYSARETPTTSTPTGGSSTSGSGVATGETLSEKNKTKGQNNFLVDYDYLTTREIELNFGDTIEFIWDEFTSKVTIENLETKEIDINKDGYLDVSITLSEKNEKIIAKLEKIKPKLSPELQEGIKVNKYLKPITIISFLMLVGILGLLIFFGIKSIKHGHFHKKKR